MYLTNYYKSGVQNAICDVCGFKFKSDELQKRWDGQMVCKGDFEYRHPQDYIRAPKPEKPPAFTRKEGAERAVDVDYIATSVGVQDTTIPSGHNNGSL